MKKKQKVSIGRWSKKKMRTKNSILILFCILLTTTQLVGMENLQEERFDLTIKNASIKELFEAIKQKTKISFMFSNNDVEQLDRKDYVFNNASLKEVLDECLKGIGLVYIVDKDVVIIRKARKGEIEKENIEVKGRVIDEDGLPLPGATVLIKGTYKGITTDEEGNYTINVPGPQTTLVFSFVGFKSQEVKVDEQSTINITLEQAATELEEVTINAGYYTVTEKTKTGNIAKVSAKEIANQPVSNPLMALQGRVAGLEITPNSSTPGVAPTIRIRGHNSLRTTDLNKSIPGSEGIDGNLPLYIIDGIPISSESLSLSSHSQYFYFGGGLDPLSTINPENIQSIEVLKDADATAIYGSRGANGVILITTKKGKSGKTELDVNFYQGAGKIPRKLELLNTQQYVDMRLEAFKNDGIDLNAFPWSLDIYKQNFYPDLAYWDTTRYTDWQKELLGGTANITDLQLNVTGGNAQTSFRLGGSYHRESQIYEGLGYHRLGGNLSLNHTSANGKFTAGVALNYGLEKNKSGGDLVNTALTMPPNAPELYLENGELNWGLTSTGIYTFDNPMAGGFENPGTSENRNLTVSANLSYLLLNGLRIKTNLGYTDLNGKSEFKLPSTIFKPDIRRFIPPSARFSTNHRQSLIIEPQLSYIKKFGKHTLDMIAGFSYQESINEYQEMSGTDYPSDGLLNSIDAAGTVTINTNFANYRYNSVFARIGYNYQERYLLNLTGRREGSSRFGQKNRFGNFGAIGAAWIFSKEPWIKQALPFISFGKLRASYGTTGNDKIGDYNFYDLYKIESSSYAYEGEASLYPSSLFNPDFQWEQTRKLEVALELNFLDDKLGLEVSWYRNRSSNQLVNYTLPATTGFSSVLKNFEATVQNTGWEILLRGELIHSEDLQWNFFANLSIPRNKLVAFPGIEDSPYANYYKVGEPLSIQRTFTWTGVDPETGLHTFLDVNENGYRDIGDQSFTYSLDSKFYGGLGSTLRYKGLEVSFLLRFKEQKARLKPATLKAIENVPLWMWNERWQEAGDITDVQRLTRTSSNFSLASSYNSLSDAITDASFIRLQTLSLSYTLPQALADKAGAKLVKIFLQGQNLFTISPYNRYVLDVERKNGGFPQLRMITAGLQLKF